MLQGPPDAPSLQKVTPGVSRNDMEAGGDTEPEPADKRVRKPDASKVEIGVGEQVGSSDCDLEKLANVSAGGTCSFRPDGP
ncbi:MAG: hypothetical protein ACI80V_003795 [Rhodothermales bacterium]|jgi:hypothetical protein